MLVAGHVERVKFVPHVCSALSVVESKSGEKQLVLNLMHLKKLPLEAKVLCTCPSLCCKGTLIVPCWPSATFWALVSKLVASL